VYFVQSFSVAANGGSYITTHHPYKINFQFGTKITSLPAQLVPESPPEYIPLSSIYAPGFDTDYLLGMLKFNLTFFKHLNSLHSYKDLFYYYNFFCHVDIIEVLTGVGIERELKKMDGRQN